MIVITGANGRLGRAIVEQLLARLPPEQVGVSVRDPEKAAALAERGVRVRRGDFADASSLRHAFEGALQVLIVSAGIGEQALQQHRTAIEMARDAGARRILYTSHMAANARSAFEPARDHAAVEEMLEATGVPFTSLRDGFHAMSGIMLLGEALQTGKLILPQDGPVSWTAHADLAQAAAVALTEEQRLNGVTPPLVATEALDFTQVAAIASERIRRPVARVTVSDDEYRARLVARGAPEAQATMFLGMFIASRHGEFASVNPTLQTVLGRPTVSMREVMAVSLPTHA